MYDIKCDSIFESASPISPVSHMFSGKGQSLRTDARVLPSSLFL